MKKEKDWFDSPNIITYLIIGLLILLIILSQSFAIQNHLGASDMLRSIFNHNNEYIFPLIYFILIRMKIGKKYFDHLNLIMTLLYFLLTVASIFTIFQSFHFESILVFVRNLLFLLYFVYAFLCDTVIGKDLHLANSPMVEVKNNQYFYVIGMVLIIYLIVSLINSSSFDGVVLILLEMMYYFLFARYIYLYKEFCDQKIKDVKKPKKSTKKESVIE